MHQFSFYTETQIDSAFDEARNKRLQVIIDFWSVGCKGCKKMEDVTYKDLKVINYLQHNYILVKYNSSNRQPGFRNTYTSSPYLWTPTFIIFSNDGSEVRKTTGYLPPDQFINELELGKAMAELRKAKSSDALLTLENLVATSNNQTIKQEALYWAGVAAFYAYGKSLSHLIPYWENLMAKYPESEWAERADCLDLVV